MGWLSFMDPALDLVFGPLLNLPDIASIIIISFLVVLIMTLITKFFTDQNLMKQLKDEMKAFQKQIKELKDQPEKAMDVQKQAMQTNMKYMMASMKATFISFIPIILILGWFQAHYAFIPIGAGEEFTVSALFNEDGSPISLGVPNGLTLLTDSEQNVVDNQAQWGLKGDKDGLFTLEFDYKGRLHTHKVQVDDTLYTEQSTFPGVDGLKELRTNYKKNVLLPLPIFNGWLATYIVFSLIWSIGLRKVLKVY